MKWLSLETFLGIFVWTAPLAILVFISSITRSTKVHFLLRCVYFPYLLLMIFAFFWFWAGDGYTNLWLVPLVFFTLIVISFRYLIPKLRDRMKILELFNLFIIICAFLTIWIVVLIHVIISKPLIIE